MKTTTKRGVVLIVCLLMAVLAACQQTPTTRDNPTTSPLVQIQLQWSSVTPSDSQLRFSHARWRDSSAVYLRACL